MEANFRGRRWPIFKYRKKQGKIPPKLTFFRILWKLKMISLLLNSLPSFNWFWPVNVCENMTAQRKSRWIITCFPIKFLFATKTTELKKHTGLLHWPEDNKGRTTHAVRMHILCNGWLYCGEKKSHDIICTHADILHIIFHGFMRIHSSAYAGSAKNVRTSTFKRAVRGLKRKTLVKLNICLGKWCVCVSIGA